MAATPFSKEEHVRELKERRKTRKEQSRFYLLPGQGGRAFVRKCREILLWALLIGLIVSCILAVMLYYLYDHR
jgi:hypothetical protein